MKRHALTAFSMLFLVTAPLRAQGALASVEAGILKDARCRKDAAANAKLASDLRGQFSLLSCTYSDPSAGLQQVLIVPKSIVPGQTLWYGSVASGNIKAARLISHYLVLEYDTQVQYLDLHKPKGGFKLSGFIANKALTLFEDLDIFKDALQKHAGVPADAPVLQKIDGLVKKAAGGKSYALQASRAKGELSVSITTGGTTSPLWP